MESPHCFDIFRLTLGGSFLNLDSRRKLEIRRWRNQQIIKMASQLAQSTLVTYLIFGITLLSYLTSVGLDELECHLEIISLSNL